MAEFLETVKEIEKICNTFTGGGGCDGCPFAHLSNEASYGRCASGILHNPKQVENIIAQWKEAHARKTWIAKLNEELPECDMDAVISGSCPGFFYKGAPRAGKGEGCDGKCKLCWHSEVSEK